MDCNKMDIKPLKITMGFADNGSPITIGTDNKTNIFIAGKSGTGKTRLLENIISDLVANYDSKEIQLCLIDTKGIEFHKIAPEIRPYINKFGNPKTRNKIYFEKDIIKGFELLAEEFDRRNLLFYQKGIVDITEYNKLENTELLPEIFVIIDEFAGLYSKNVFDKLPNHNSMLFPLVMLCQHVNVGIHFIMTTQRPCSYATETMISQSNYRVLFKTDSVQAIKAVLGNEDAASQSLNPGEFILYDTDTHDMMLGYLRDPLDK